MQVYPSNYSSKLSGFHNNRLESAIKKTKKRTRRTAAEIERKFVCKEKECGKAYGSEGALKMHVKLKHSTNRKPKRLLNNNLHIQCIPQTIYPAPIVPKRILPSMSYMKLQVPITNVSPCWIIDEDKEAISQSSTTISNLQLDNVVPEMPNTDFNNLVNVVTHEQYNGFPCGSIYFSTINSPLGSQNIFTLNNVKIGNWSQLSYSAVDLSLHFYNNTICYYIEDCTLPLDCLQISTTLKIEFAVDSVTEYFIESRDGILTVVISLKYSPFFYSCSVPRGHIYSLDSIDWTPIKDFTCNNATEFRFNILRLHQTDPRTECRLKGLFSANNIPLNDHSTVELEDGTVLQLKNQLINYEPVILNQKFSSKEGPFTGALPLFLINNKSTISLPSLPKFSLLDESHRLIAKDNSVCTFNDLSIENLLSEDDSETLLRQLEITS